MLTFLLLLRRWIKIKTLKIYTDGSYDKRTPEWCGFAGVILNENGFCDIIYGADNTKEYQDLWNIGGEILAAQNAILYVKDRYNFESIEIYHDYIGISKWAVGLWKTNKVATKKYRDFMRDVMKQYKISFQHVKGHSGNKYNEMADKFAKAGIKLAMNDGNSTFKILLNQ